MAPQEAPLNSAFIEWLCPGHIGLVRAGPNCHRYGDPYEFVVTFVIGGADYKVATLKGFVNPSADRAMPTQLMPIIRVLRSAGFKPWFQRIKPKKGLPDKEQPLPLGQP